MTRTSQHTPRGAADEVPSPVAGGKTAAKVGEEPAAPEETAKDEAVADPTNVEAADTVGTAAALMEMEMEMTEAKDTQTAHQRTPACSIGGGAVKHFFVAMRHHARGGPNVPHLRINNNNETPRLSLPH